MATVAHKLATPDRSRTQRLDALALANGVRTNRAHLKLALKAGSADLRDVLLAPPGFVLTARVFDMLIAAPKYGHVKTTKMLAQCRIAPSKTVGGLTPRQRNELIRLLSLDLGRRTMPWTST